MDKKKIGRPKKETCENCGSTDVHLTGLCRQCYNGYIRKLKYLREGRAIPPELEHMPGPKRPDGWLPKWMTSKAASTRDVERGASLRHGIPEWQFQHCSIKGLFDGVPGDVKAALKSGDFKAFMRATDGKERRDYKAREGGCGKSR